MMTKALIPYGLLSLSRFSSGIIIFFRFSYNEYVCIVQLCPNVLTSASQISQARVREWNVVVCGWMLREQI